MGNVRVEKRGNTWRYMFEIAKQDGQRKRITKGGFTTKKEATQAGIDAKAQYDNVGSVVINTEISYHDYYQYWIDHFGKTNLAFSTIENYNKKYRLYIQPTLGRYKLKNLNSECLQNLIDELFNTGMSRNSLINIKGILSSSLGYAVTTCKYLKDNPALAVKLPNKNIKPKTHIQNSIERIVVTPEMFDVITKRFDKTSPAYIPLLLGYKCGLRLGEAYAVDANDLDEENKTIYIRYQALKIDNDWYMKPPKYNSQRLIDLDDETFNFLLMRKKKMDKDKEYYGDLYNHLYIDELGKVYNENGKGRKEINLFTRYDNGALIQRNTMCHYSRVIHYELKMPDWNFHSMRHTHTTNLIVAGADIKYIMDRLGHKNIQTTIEIYTHLSKRMREKNVQILNNL